MVAYIKMERVERVRYRLRNMTLLIFCQYDQSLEY